MEMNTVLAGKYLVKAKKSKNGQCVYYEGYDLCDEVQVLIQEYFPESLVYRDTKSVIPRVLLKDSSCHDRYHRGMEAFVKEAMFLSQFAQVSGVISVKDMFNENGTVYIVREYVEGITLYDYVRNRGNILTETEALQFLKPVMEALEAIHKAGYYHGDFTSREVILTNTNQIKLLGFSEDHKFGINDIKMPPVVILHPVGAPEQYHSRAKIGPWTDVFCVCALLYGLLSGKQIPCIEDRLLGKDVTKFEELRIKVRPNTSEAIMKGLALRAEDRIQSIKELMEYLYEGKKVKLR